MGRREKIIAIGLLAVLLGSLVWSGRNFYMARTMAVPGSGGTYSEGLMGQPQYINPLLAGSETDLALEHLIFSGLYKYDDAGQLVPDLADGMPQISDDQKAYVINLKKNVTWQNGQPFTADDVVYTIETLQDPDYNSPQRGLWLSTTVTKLGDYQVQFTTKDISGPFIYNLTIPIISKNIWQNVSPQNFLTSTNNLQAVGTGPYSISEIQKEQSGKIDAITLAAFAGYYAGQPKIKTINVKFYDSNDDLVDALHSREILGLGFSAAASSLRLTATKNTQILTAPLPEYQTLFYNLTNPLLADVAVRAALNQDVDRQSIINNIFKGNARLPNAPFTLAPYNIAGPAINYNPAAAAAALAADGWSADPSTKILTKNGAQLKLSLATNDTLVNSQTAQAIADNWRALGVQVDLTILSTQDLTNNLIRPRAFDVLIFPIKLGADPDPFSFWQSSQVKDPGLNLTGFADQNADKLINQARATTNTAAREILYEQLNAYINAQSPVLYLNQSLYQYALSTQVKNVNFSVLYDESDRFQDVADWYIMTKRVWK
jgi:peptide/nickel transport system substrate-binding protein